MPANSIRMDIHCIQRRSRNGIRLVVPAGAPVISVQGAGRETVAFQLMITAGSGTAL